MDADMVEDVHIMPWQVKKTSTSGAGKLDLVAMYLREIGRTPLLTAEAERTLGQQVHLMQSVLDCKVALTQTLGREPTQVELADQSNLSLSELDRICRDGHRAKQHMVQANLRLVVAIAKKYQHRSQLELLDLIQEGSLGLERAVEKFDPSLGYRFSTYAYWWIWQGVTRAIAAQSRTIRLPIYITGKLNAIKRVERELSQRLNRRPTVAEIGHALNLKPEDLLQYLQLAHPPQSLNKLVGEQLNCQLIDLIEDPHASPEEDADRQSLAQSLKTLLGKLSSQHQEVINLRYGLIDGQELSLEKISKRMGLSRERVRQLQQSALKQLRKHRNLVQGYLAD